MRVKLTAEERLAHHRESSRRWDKAHPEKRREVGQKWIEAHPEKCREARHRRYYANPEKYRERARRARKANPEKQRESARRWREAHLGESRESASKWRKAHRYEHAAQEQARSRIPLADACELCGAKARHRHHPDYSQPLRIMHVCASCHKRIHMLDEVIAIDHRIRGV